MKKERGQEGEKEPATPLLNTLEDILHNRNTAKEKRDIQEPKHSRHRKIMERHRRCTVYYGRVLASADGNRPDTITNN
jgi:hypothetical protein